MHCRSVYRDLQDLKSGSQDLNLRPPGPQPSDETSYASAPVPIVPVVPVVPVVDDAGRIRGGIRYRASTTSRLVNAGDDGDAFRG
jgi:hypothetical protein